MYKNDVLIQNEVNLNLTWYYRQTQVGLCIMNSHHLQFGNVSTYEYFYT